MKMGHNVGIFGEDLQQAVGDIGRFERTEADACQAGNGGQLIE
jgi:hypothetical protein